MDKIVNAGVRITRNCTMRCKYCNITARKRKDLSYEEWKDAFKIVKNFGVSDVVLLGGEPTKYEHIIELVDYLVNDLNMNISLTTNAFKNEEIVLKLLEIGLTRLGFSIDSLDSNNSISYLKNKCGLELLNKIIDKNIKYNKLVDYVVLNKKNAKDIEELVKYMTSKNVSTYFIPFHSGNEGSFEHRKNDDLYAFKKEDLDLYNEAIDTIIKLKNDGYMIDNSFEFLEMSRQHIVDLDWKCDGLSELRFDSDGSMLCCCDNVGEVNDRFTIFDLKDEKKLNEFIKLRRKDASKCSGCLWPSSFEAERKRGMENDI